MTATAKKTFDQGKALTPLTVEREKLTPAQERLWEQSRTLLMMSAPGFCHLLYSMMNPQEPTQAVFTKEVPIAATDGLYAYFNPETWFKYALGERVFINIHEICHAMLNHMVQQHHWQRAGGVIRYVDGTTLPYVNGIMQKAMDCVINDMIVESKFDRVTIPAECKEKGFWQPGVITYKDSILDAYKKVYEQQKGKDDGQSGIDVHLAPGKGQGKDPAQAAQDRSDAAWKTAVVAAMAAQKAQGKLPAAMEHVLGEVLEPQIAWEDKVLGFFQRKLGAGSYDFRRPDRRFMARPERIFTPARSGYGAEHVICAVDTSGSIYASPKTLEMFFGELSGMLTDLRPRRLSVIWCDAKVHRVDELDDGGDLQQLRCRKVPGGGGTSFVPVFEHITNQGWTPDALIYLTDGQGTFPGGRPTFPVLWGSILEKPKHYPFGEVVMIPKVVA